MAGEMLLVKRLLVSFLLVAAGCRLAVADTAPTYAADTGSVTFTAPAYGNADGGIVNAGFTFSGPDVYLTGSSSTIDPPNDFVGSDEQLGIVGRAPYSNFLWVYAEDNRFPQGSATVGGTEYSDVVYFGLAALSGDSFLLTPDMFASQGEVTVSVPATVTGSMTACIPDSACTLGYGPTISPFSVDVDVSGTLTLTYARVSGSTPPQYGEFVYLTTATFTPSPEPAMWMLMTSGLLAVGAQRLMRRRREVIVIQDGVEDESVAG